MFLIKLSEQFSKEEILVIKNQIMFCKFISLFTRAHSVKEGWGESTFEKG